jgi:hypothetical protein
MTRMVSVRLACVLAFLLGPAAAQTLDFYDINAYRTIYLSFSQPNYWTLLTNNYASQTEIAANMTVDGVTYPNVGVRFRGNTSYTQLPPGSQKKSFNIRLDSFVPGQDIQGYDHLNLNNGFHDPLFLREFLSYYVMRKYGEAPGCNFVKLYINNEYWGVYINVQQPNKDWARQWFRSDSGNRYRGFPTTGTFSNGRCAMTWLGNQVSSYLSAYQANQGDGVDLMNLCDILNNTPQANLENTLPVIFSVDSFYRYAAVMNVLTNTDSYLGSGKDHYLYHDNVYGQFHIFPYDLNESLAGSTTLDPWYQTTSQYRPAFSKTLPITNWRNRWLAHYRTVAEDTMDWNVLGAVATQFHTMIAADVAADTKKIYTTAQFNTNLTAPVTIPVGFTNVTVPGLQPLIQGRRNYILAHVDMTAPRPALAQLAHAPAAPTPSQSVTITVQATGPVASVKLWRRSAGAFASTPMFDDGLHGDGAAGDGVYGVILGPMGPGTLLDYYVEAASGIGTTSYLPKTAEHKARSLRFAWPMASSVVKINEFLAANTNVIQDPFGEWEDYVELYNASSQPVNVGGWYLTDNLSNPTKWMIPAGQVIAPQGTLLIWCDEDGSQGPLHANFKLSAQGEAVALFAPDGLTQYDIFEFGAQATNVSTGRLLDGAGPWVTLPAPTPNARNEQATCGVRLYSAQSFSSHTIALSAGGSTAIGAVVAVQALGGPAGAPALFVISGAPAHDAVPGTSIAALVSLQNALLLPLNLDGSGNWGAAFPLPNDPAWVGARIFAQLAAADGATLRASNGLELVICP